MRRVTPFASENARSSGDGEGDGEWDGGIVAAAHATADFDEGGVEALRSTGATPLHCVTTDGRNWDTGSAAALEIALSSCLSGRAGSDA